MAIQPQLFRAPLDPQGEPRPFAELPLEQQVDLQGQQMLQLQRVIAMQQWQMAASADVQASLELQSTQLQALALETHEVANVRIINTDQALAEKTMECAVKDARIAALEAQLASQQAVHAAVKAAAEQTIDTQAKTISSQREENAILSKAFDASSKGMHEYVLYPAKSMERLRLHHSGAIKNLEALPALIQEASAELHQHRQANLTSPPKV